MKENKTPKYAVISSAPGDDFAEFLTTVSARKEEEPKSAVVVVLLPEDQSASARVLYHNAAWQDIGMAAQYLNLCFCQEGIDGNRLVKPEEEVDEAVDEDADYNDYDD